MKVLTIAIIHSFFLFLANPETSKSGSFISSIAKSCSSSSVFSEDIMDVVDEDICEFKELFVFGDVVE
jgi:hypothetical protein